MSFLDNIDPDEEFFYHNRNLFNEVLDKVVSGLQPVSTGTFFEYRESKFMAHGKEVVFELSIAVDTKAIGFRVKSENEIQSFDNMFKAIVYICRNYASAGSGIRAVMDEIFKERVEKVSSH